MDLVEEPERKTMQPPAASEMQGRGGAWTESEQGHREKEECRLDSRPEMLAGGAPRDSALHSDPYTLY